MSRYKIIPAAARELEEAALNYEAASEGLGVDFMAEFDRAMELVIAMPHAWLPVDAEYRRYLLRRFPYALIYRLDGSLVIVTSVFHQHRRPDSWRIHLK